MNLPCTTNSVRRLCLLYACFAALLHCTEAALPALTTQDETTLTRFAGVLSEPGAETGAILRRFEALLLSGSDQDFFALSDDPRHGCPWPESFGAMASSGDRDAVQPHIVYEYDGLPVSVNLPPLRLSLPDDIATGSRWESGDWAFTAADKREADGTPVWQIRADGRRGRHQQLLVEAESGILAEATVDVFMGRGDQFAMTLRRTESAALPPRIAQITQQKQQQLLDLQRQLDRRPDAQQRELTARQVQAVESAITSLVQSPETHPLSPIVQRVQTDLTRQRSRLAAGDAMAVKVVGQPAPSFSLHLINGRNFSSELVSGKTVILHFWHYRDQPLTEPYGQTGYLEFLQQQENRNRTDDPPLVVIGVSTNSEFQSAETAARARRSARKLAEFMNLSYAIGYDDGALLRSLGDPRVAAGSLPLWIVINPQGHITHYHAGTYEVDPREGLKELQQHVQQAD